MKYTEKDTSKYIALILRHKPETIGITLDEHGWADVRELIEGISKTHPLDMDLLEKIVREDEKQRYSFNEDKTLIRANQGHSIPVDVELEEVVPPEILYHGTGEKYVTSIDKQGLLPKSRLYVHLSSDQETAVKVGQRHGRPVVYIVDSKKMHEDGYRFFRSVNHVWLTKEVPPVYLRKFNKETVLGLKRGTVKLCPHDPEWEKLSTAAAVELKEILNDVCEDVQPVGSTAVRSISAKPIIDLAVGTKDFERVLEKVPELEKHGYILRKDERPRELFLVKGDLKEDFITHHIHVIPYDGKEWNDYLSFRDYLNSDPEAAKRYENAKTELAQRFAEDRASYTAGKARIILRLLEEAKQRYN